jgi:hypothetical protein
VLGIHDYRLFVLASVLLNLTPGHDTFYIIGCSIARGGALRAARRTARRGPAPKRRARCHLGVRIAAVGK